jgi:hypothetical protein
MPYFPGINNILILQNAFGGFCWIKLREEGL